LAAQLHARLERIEWMTHGRFGQTRNTTTNQVLQGVRLFLARGGNDGSSRCCGSSVRGRSRALLIRHGTHKMYEWCGDGRKEETFCGRGTLEVSSRHMHVMMRAFHR
jgi:hypothetical protein